jgi:hypothetical protein
MGIVSKDFTFSAGAVISATEHNTNFDTLYNVVNANLDNANIKTAAAIASSKLNLATIAQNVTFTGTLDFSSATITAQTTFADLVATTADINAGTVDATIGGTTPAAGTFTTITGNTSLALATGATVTGIADEDDMSSDSDTLLATQQSIKAYADSLGGFTLTSATAVSTASNTGNITIAANKIYKVVFEFTITSSTAEWGLRFNSDSSSSSYDGTGGTTEIDLTAGTTADPNDELVGEFIISTTKRNSRSAFVQGKTSFLETSGAWRFYDFAGRWLDNATITDFEIAQISGTGVITGNVYLYELALS